MSHAFPYPLLTPEPDIMGNHELSTHMGCNGDSDGTGSGPISKAAYDPLPRPLQAFLASFLCVKSISYFTEALCRGDSDAVEARQICGFYLDKT